MWTEQVPCLGALLAFCVNQGISASFSPLFSYLQHSFFQFSSVQFSHSVVSDSLRPHELQHNRPPCPLPTPGVHSDSRPSSPWCHPAISSSVVPFSSCPQCSSQHQSLFQWVNSSYEVAHVLELQLKHHSFRRNPGLISFRMDWLDLLAVQGNLKSLLQNDSSKESILWHSAFFTVQLTSIHDHWKNYSLD